ncbi:18178_t:CDS:2 [Funneliformis geosporum]|nr:18178_t:CDS:2 [Funneliformis geosporum]
MKAQNLEENPVVAKSKRGRKAFAVSEGYMDPTGKTHIMTVRRSNPPTPKKKAPNVPKAIKQSNNGCSRCNQNKKYSTFLMNKLTNYKVCNEKHFSIFNQSSAELFERQNQTQLQVQIATPITTSTPNIVVPDQFVNTTIPRSYIGLEIPFQIQHQLQLQTQLVAPTTASTPTYIDLIERIERLECYNILTNEITQIQTQMETPNYTYVSRMESILKSRIDYSID